MIGYILNEEQYNEVQGKFINSYEFIHCVQDANGVYFFIENYANKNKYTEYLWLFDLPQAEYTPPPQPELPY